MQRLTPIDKLTRDERREVQSLLMSRTMMSNVKIGKEREILPLDLGFISVAFLTRLHYMGLLLLLQAAVKKLKRKIDRGTGRGKGYGC
jgi:hypothetical protein